MTIYQQRIRERQVVAISFEDDERVKDVFQPLFIEEMEEKQKIAMARLLNYLYRTQKRSLDHLQPVSSYKINHYMKIDLFLKTKS